MRGANLDGMMFDNCRLTSADLTGASIRRAEFKGFSQLRRIIGEHTVWHFTDLEGTDFGQACPCYTRATHLCYTRATPVLHTCATPCYVIRGVHHIPQLPATCFP